MTLPGKTLPPSRCTAPSKHTLWLPIGWCRRGRRGQRRSPGRAARYITVTNAYKDQDNTLSTEERGCKRRRSKERSSETERQRGVKKGEVVREGGREAGRGQRGISFLLNKTERKWPFYTLFRRCGRVASVDVNGVHGR